MASPSLQAEARAAFAAYNQTHWRDMPGASSTPSAVCHGAFVSLLSGDRYVAGAFCLHRSLVALGSACPLVLVYDDRFAERAPSNASLRLLVRTFGPENLVPITSLFSQLPGISHRVRTNFSVWREFRFEQRRPLPAPTAVSPRRSRRVPATAGRRLYAMTFGAELYATHLKLWLWALPAAQYPRIVLLDLDMVVTANLDFLLSSSRALSASSVAAVLGCQGAFNSGLMIARPSLSDLGKLLGVLKHAAHLKRACEVKPGDQSILNHYFRHRWEPLPVSIATKWKGKTGATWNKYDPAILHFSSEPKPWDLVAKGTEMQGLWAHGFGCRTQQEIERAASSEASLNT